MRAFAHFLIAASLALYSTADARPYDDIMTEAREAFAAEDFLKASALLDEAQAQRPYSLYLTRNRILARLLTDRSSEAIALAADLAAKGLVLETPAHEAFERMKALPDYAPIAARMTENAKPVGAPVVKIEFPENGLLPEAISLRKKRLLIGAVRTGEIRDASANLSTTATLDGGVFDLEETKKSIFAAVNNQLAFERRDEAPAFAAIVELDRRSGAERRRISPNADGVLFGDFEIGADGAIFASDSLSPRIFRAAPASSTLSVFATDERWANLQGVAFDRKSGRLFVSDYLTGLYSIDVETVAVTQIANPTNAHLGGIDGLYLHKGDLIGVQNGVAPPRIVRVRLNEAGDQALALEILAQNLPEWTEPTHGVVNGGRFDYIATSNWPSYDDDGNLREGASPAPLRIMTIELDRPEN